MEKIMDFEAVWLSLQLAWWTTVTLFALGLPLAYWLAVTRWRLKFLLEAIVVLPMILSFAHTLGEFGVVLMVGGNIPGVTRTVSISIYDEVQAVNYGTAAMTSF